MTYAGTIGRRRQRTGTWARWLMVPLGAFGVALVFAAMAYMLWPQPAAMAPDAPSVPITVGGVVFNIPPAAIRFKVQRRPGSQARVDLSFVWPSLDPPDNRIKPPTTAPPDVTNRLFATIATSDSTLPPMERLKVIYPRYLGGAAIIGPDGLSVQGFRDGSPYQGEDVIFEPAAAERSLLRCTRPVGSTPAMCLHERRIGVKRGRAFCGLNDAESSAGPCAHEDKPASSTERLHNEAHGPCNLGQLALDCADDANILPVHEAQKLRR